MIHIGIDPGVSGGIAWIESDGSTTAVKMPDALGELWKLFDYFRCSNIGERHFCLLERLGAMPRDKHGKAKQSPTTMFKMGVGYGHLEMGLRASGMPFDTVLPRTWQQAMGLIASKHETQTQKKNRHKELAGRLFPSLKVIHATADALLLAEYGRRQRGHD